MPTPPLFRTRIRGQRQVRGATIENDQIRPQDLTEGYAGITLDRLQHGSDLLKRVPSGVQNVPATVYAGGRLTDLAPSVEASDAVTRAELAAFSSGVSVKQACRLASTTNLDIAEEWTYGGPSIQAPDYNGYQTSDQGVSSPTLVDGKALNLYDRVLAKNQTDSKYNGIYVVGTTGFSRAVDADQTGELVPGSLVFVTDGLTQKNTMWVVSNTTEPVFNTDPINWTMFSAAGNFTAGSGIAVNGTVISVRGHNGITLTNGSVAIRLASNGGLGFDSGATEGQAGVLVKLDSTSPGLALTALGLKLGTVLDTNIPINTISANKVSAPTDGRGHVLTGGATGGARFKLVSGEVSMTNEGVFTLGDDAMRHSAVTTQGFDPDLFNGNTVTFSLSGAPVNGFALVVKNGVLQRYGAAYDYTISGAALTFTEAPSAGDSVFVMFWKTRAPIGDPNED